MGTVIVHNTCDTGITIEWRQNGPNAVPIEGLYVEIDTPTGMISPLPVAGTIDAAPSAEYTVRFVMTDGNGPGEDVVWGSETVTTPALLTDCIAVPTTAPVDGASTTAPPAPVPSTTAPVGVNLPCPLPQFRPGIGWECPPESVDLPCPLPLFDGDNWVCPAPTPEVTAPPAIDLATATTATVEVSDSTLPATGLDSDSVLPLGGGLLLLTGAVLAIVARRRHLS